jgi:hypothetical protein
MIHQPHDPHHWLHEGAWMLAVVAVGVGMTAAALVVGVLLGLLVLAL